MENITRYATPTTGRAYPPFSIAVGHAGTLYVSGLGPMLPDGKVPAGFAAQFACVMDHMRRVLADAGTDMTRILKCNVLLTRATDVAEMNRLYAAAFPADNLPARTTCVVAALPVPDFLLEIECIAAIG
jgi:enamine deaminase RidA (YjgF/YER057c/UK114 family)